MDDFIFRYLKTVSQGRNSRIGNDSSGIGAGVGQNAAQQSQGVFRLAGDPGAFQRRLLIQFGLLSGVLAGLPSPDRKAAHDDQTSNRQGNCKAPSPGQRPFRGNPAAYLIEDSLRAGLFF